MIKNKTDYTRIYDRFQYHLADTDCSVCLYWKGSKHGCSLTACCCEDIKNEAIADGRIKRRKSISCRG